MRSILVEFHRFGGAEGFPRKGDRYLRTLESEAVAEVEMALDYKAFMRLMKKLRYESDETAAEEARLEVGRVVTDLLKIDDLVGATSAPQLEPAQIDLVLNSYEMSALPFELAVRADGAPLFVDDKCPLIVTRRIRQKFTGRDQPWPSSPRLLFAWASPEGAGAPVPSDDHRAALARALAPWIAPLQGFPQAAPDDRGVLHVVERATANALQAVIAKAIRAGTPFTHIHILAHGVEVGEEDFEKRYGIALHSDDGGLDRVDAERLKSILEPTLGTCVGVSIMSCDSANEARNMLIPERSVAHELHASGFPVVLSSQFPLTFAGSIVVTEEFYKRLLQGEDVRLAIHEARMALHRSRQQTRHDWASLVAYVSLPMDYELTMERVGMASQLAALRTAQKWSDHLLENRITDYKAFDRVEGALQSRVKTLEKFLRRERRTHPELLENLGLLGSAEKRRGELLFEWWRADPKDRYQQEMLEALRRSSSWYKKAFSRNLSHHWTGCQQLSLEVALDGKMERPGLWHAAVEAAAMDAESENEVWACGSLMELYLLAAFANQPEAEGKARAAFALMHQRVEKQNKDSFPIESTRRQLSRYLSWWKPEHGFQRLSGEKADRLRALAQSLLDTDTTAGATADT